MVPEMAQDAGVGGTGAYVSGRTGGKAPLNWRYEPRGVFSGGGDGASGLAPRQMETFGRPFRRGRVTRAELT